MERKEMVMRDWGRRSDKCMDDSSGKARAARRDRGSDVPRSPLGQIRDR